MSWSPREERAINHYLNENDLRLELQPGKTRTVYMQDKRTGDRIQANLDLMLVIYDQDRADRAKARARARRAEQREAAQS